MIIKFVDDRIKENDVIVNEISQVKYVLPYLLKLIKFLITSASKTFLTCTGIITKLQILSIFSTQPFALSQNFDNTIHAKFLPHKIHFCLCNVMGL